MPIEQINFLKKQELEDQKKKKLSFENYVMENIDAIMAVFKSKMLGPPTSGSQASHQAKNQKYPTPSPPPPPKYQTKQIKQSKVQPSKPKREFTPLPRPLSTLLPKFVQKGHINYPKGKQNATSPRMAKYRQDLSCDYHKVRGHDKCLKLQHLVQDLLEKGQLNTNQVDPGMKDFVGIVRTFDQQ